VNCPRNKWWEQFKIFYDLERAAEAKYRAEADKRKAREAGIADRESGNLKRQQLANKRFHERDALN
jgi:hypothetical protein